MGFCVVLDGGTFTASTLTLPGTALDWRRGTLGITTGASRREDLLAAGATVVVDHADEILGVVCEGTHI